MVSDENIFGDFDYSDIPEDPNYVADGTYLAEVRDAKFHNGNNGKSLIVEWVIDDPSSSYHEQPIPAFLFIPEKPADQLDRKEKYRLQLTFQTLRDGFGYTKENRHEATPEKLIGQRNYLTVENREGSGSTAGQMQSRIVKVQTEKKYKENESALEGLDAFM